MVVSNDINVKVYKNGSSIKYLAVAGICEDSECHKIPGHYILDISVTRHPDEDFENSELKNITQRLVQRFRDGKWNRFVETSEQLMDVIGILSGQSWNLVAETSTDGETVEIKSNNS